MITLKAEGVYLLDGKTIATESAMSKDEARENTIAYQILRKHDVEGGKGKDDTLFALVDGTVKFERMGKDRKKVSVYEEIAQ